MVVMLLRRLVIHLTLVELPGRQISLHSQLGCYLESPRVVIHLLHSLNRVRLSEAITTFKATRRAPHFRISPFHFFLLLLELCYLILCSLLGLGDDLLLLFLI